MYRWALCVAVVSLSLSALGQSRTPSERCRAACERSLHSPVDREQICSTCVLNPAPASWLERARPLPQAARFDADWRIRVAWFTETSDRSQQTVEQALQSALVSQPQSRTLDCDAAVRWAGLKGRPFASVFTSTAKNSVRSLCTPVLKAVRDTLEFDMFNGTRELGLEALQLGSMGLGLTPARLVLDVLNERPTLSAERGAELLTGLVASGGEPAGLALLREARATDTGSVNRLLEVYSRVRDRERPQLSSASTDVRREAIVTLGALAPLSAPELSQALNDSSAELRIRAAQALAAGEGRTLGAAVKARFETGAKAQPAERRVWLQVLEKGDPAECAAVSRTLVRDATQADVVRAQALVTHSACAAMDDPQLLVDAAQSRVAALRVAVAQAVNAQPGGGPWVSLLEPLLGDTSSEVLSAALTTVANLHLTAYRTQVAALSTHSETAIRAQAFRTLVVLDEPNAPMRLSTALMKSTDVEQRLVACELAATRPSPQVISALRGAAQNDEDPRVKLAADAALRRLGITRPPRRIR